MNSTDTMKRIFILSLFVLSSIVVTGQTKIQVNSIRDTVRSITHTDTLKTFLLKKDVPYLFNANLNHKEKSLFNKVIRGSFYDMGYNTVILSGLIFAPESFSKWENKKEKFKFSSIMNQYKSAYTNPPVIDSDLWMTNYLGHPYQGSYYYNSIRCQGGSVLQSSLFSLGQAVLWEYVWEAGVEQPSVQDLITTPLGGILLGEASHFATIAMSKHGFTWYEIAIVCAINPAYAINNGFRFNRPLVGDDRNR